MGGVGPMGGGGSIGGMGGGAPMGGLGGTMGGGGMGQMRPGQPLVPTPSAAGAAPGGSMSFGSLDPLAMLNTPPAPGKGMQLGGVKKVAATKAAADDWDKW